MTRDSVQSKKDLKIGEYIEGRKIVGKLVSQPGVYHYQVPKAKRYPRFKPGQARTFISEIGPLVSFRVIPARKGGY